MRTRSHSVDPEIRPPSQKKSCQTGLRNSPVIIGNHNNNNDGNDDNNNSNISSFVTALPPWYIGTVVERISTNYITRLSPIIFPLFEKSTPLKT